MENNKREIGQRRLGKKSASNNFFNPFPGLRAFGIEESHLFFGREGQSNEVLMKLLNNRFVAVIGASGSGKSSLMYCGLTPVLYGGLQTPFGTRWKMIVTRPGGGPMSNLANALVKTYPPKNDEDLVFTVSLATSVLKGSSLGLVEALKQLNISKDENILIMVDQFEELFRYKRSSSDSKAFNESIAFVKILLEAVKCADLPVYVVLTMRSDFIGECAQFPDLTYYINESHYLIPQMTRENLHRAIVGPVAVGGGEISPKLVHTLLNEIGDNSDQLPILQHALMRSWSYWEKNRQADEPMDLVHYNAIGRMDKALSEHANEAFEELGMSLKYVCERMFKAITEIGSDNRGVRRPMKIKEIAHIAKVAETEVISVVEVFRKPGRSFVLPSIDFALTEESIVDISHEALMRVWDKLKVWVEEESHSVKMYMRLAVAAAEYQEGKGSLWRPPDLLLALDWQNKQKPTEAWAVRYDPALERVLSFLDTSKKAYDAEESNKLKMQKKALKRSRIFAMVLGVASLVSLGFMLYAVKAKIEATNNEGKANMESVKAYGQSLLSTLNARVAYIQTKNAEQSEGLAKMEGVNAYRQTLIAELSAHLANIQSIKTKEQKTIADKEAKRANTEKQKADSARLNAVSARDMADRLRRVSVAQSMAIKSLQLTDDTIQSIVAYQAFLYYSAYSEADDKNPDIYNGLYEALKNKNKKAANGNLPKVFSSDIKAVVGDPFDESFYAAGSDGRIFWVRGNSSSLIYKNKSDNRALAVTSGGGKRRVLACANGNTIQIFSFTSVSDKMMPTKTIIGHTGKVNSLRFSSDGKSLFSMGSDMVLRRCYLDKSDSAISVFDCKKQKINVSAFALLSPSLLVLGTETGSILKYDVSNSSITTIYSPKSGVSPIQCLDISSDNQLLAFGDRNGLVQLLRLDNSEANANNLNNSLGRHLSRSSSIRFSRDNKMLASCGFDGTVYIWDVKKINKQPLMLKDLQSWGMCVDFTHDGKNLIAGYKDGNLLLWKTNPDDLAAALHSTIARDMTKSEWERFVSNNLEYEHTKSFTPAEYKKTHH